MIKNYLKSISFEIAIILAIGILMGLMLLNVPNALAADGPNLILNPSFENSSGNLATNWRTAFWPDTTVAAFDIVEGAGGAGTKAARVKINSYGTEGDAKWYPDDVNVTAGSYYTFSDKYKSNIASNVVVRFNKGTCDTVPADCSYLPLGTLASSSVWQTFSAGFTPPVGTISVTIFHVIEGVGELRTDDFSLSSSTSTNPISFDQGMISLTFDDGWKSIHTNALPILQSKNFKSTQYLIANTITETGEGEDGYMSKADVLDFNAKGHEIAAHTFSHPNLITPNMSDNELQKEIAGARYKLLTDLNVKPVNGLAYTYGLYNDRVTQAVKEAGFLGARTVDNGFNDKTSNRYLLKSLVVERGGLDTGSGEQADPTLIEDVKTAIDAAAVNKTWLVLTFHQIDNVAENVYGASIAMFQEIIDYIAQKNVPVKTMADALRLMPGVAAAENIAPVISPAPNINATTSSTSTVVTFALPAVSDNVDQGLKPYCSSDGGLMSGSAFPLGETVIRCQAMDSSGNVATSTTFRVIVSDVNNPSYIITPTAGANGSISPSSPTNVASGTSQVYAITPNTGYKVENVIVDEVPMGALTSYTFSNVSRNHTISVSFSAINPGTISISPANPTILRGNKLQFAVTLPASTTATSTWSSSDMNIATIDNAGLATSLAKGTTTITVSNGTSSASVLLTVNDPIASLIITPATSTISVGATAQFVASIPGGSTSTATSTWSSSNANVATINNNGLATALAVGTTTITVTNGTSTASALLTVENPISSVTISPATSTIAIGATQQFTATIINPATTTATSTWSSSNLAVANINASGLATALSAGTTTITVINGTATATALLTVTPSVTVMSISPATSTILVGASIQFISNIPATSTATSTWSSSNANVAAINQNGLATGLTIGTTTITFVNGTSTASALLTVSNMTLSPATSTIMVGATQQFMINMATTSTTTATSTWASSNNNVATVDQNGLATGLALGTTTITATNGTNTASAILTVNPLITINISPATSTIAVGATQQFTATMLASTTATSTWSSSNINVATIDQNGLATGKAVGTTTIAVINGTSTASALLTVNAAVVNPPSSGGGSGGGGGGGIYIPGNIEAINTPLVITSSQAGLIKVSIDNNNKISLSVPSGAVGSTTKFTVQVVKASAYEAQDLSDNAAIIGEYVYEIVATDANGNKVTSFAKDLSFTINTPLPANLNGVGIYYLDSASNRWILISDSSFDQDTNKITFKANHLSAFAIMKTSSLSNNINILNPGVVIPTSTPTSTKAVLGVKVFVDGTLIRQVGDPRIYVIVKGERQLIRNLEELRRYAGKKIILVDADGNEVKVQIKKYNNGDLLRTPNGRIYVIVNNKLMRVRTLAELRRNHFRKAINNVGDDVIRSYQLSN